MKFSTSISTLLSISALLVSAEKVRFKVLAVNGTPILNIDGKQHPMTLDEYPLYKVDVDVDSFPVNYNYIVDSETEQFTRTREKDDVPLNEFFNRKITLKKHPELPRAYKAFEYFEPSKLYDDRFVATIVVKCDEKQLEELYEDTHTKDKIPAEVVYASPFAVKTFKEANFTISGESTRNVPKLSYKINNLKNGKKELYSRTAIKLRAEHMDFSYLRDKIYGDIVNSLGVPTVQNTFTRLYINGRDIGLFDLTDDITNNRYLRETFNSGKKYSDGQENPIYKVNCDEDDGVYGDLGYYGDEAGNDMYGAYVYRGDDKITKGSEHVAKDIIPLIKEIDDYKSGRTNSFPLDSDTFLKSMAIEFLGGAIDNYWNKPGNYYLYKDNSKNKWYFHDADFHYTFGVNYGQDEMLNTPLAEYPPVSGSIKKERAPLDALRSHPDIDTKFKGIIERLLKTSFHEKALFPRIDSLAELIRDDAQWDISIEKKENSHASSGNSKAESIELFDKETKSEEEKGGFGGLTLRYFIKNRVALVSNELGVQLPATFENDLGTVEAPAADKVDEKKDAKSASIKSWSKSSWTIALLFLAFSFYY